MLKFTRAALVGLVLAGAGTGAATASADVDRQVIVDDVEVEHSLNTCSGVEGTFTRTFNGAIQTVSRPDGSSLFRGRIRADDATFVPDDPSQPTYTGRETVQVSSVTSNATGVMTFVLHFWASGTDGSSVMFEETEHMTLNESGEHARVREARGRLPRQPSGRLTHPRLRPIPRMPTVARTIAAASREIERWAASRECAQLDDRRTLAFGVDASERARAGRLPPRTRGSVRASAGVDSEQGARPLHAGRRARSNCAGGVGWSRGVIRLMPPLRGAVPTKHHLTSNRYQHRSTERYG